MKLNLWWEICSLLSLQTIYDVRCEEERWVTWSGCNRINQKWKATLLNFRKVDPQHASMTANATKRHLRVRKRNRRSADGKSWRLVWKKSPSDCLLCVFEPHFEEKVSHDNRIDLLYSFFYSRFWCPSRFFT